MTNTCHEQNQLAKEGQEENPISNAKIRADDKCYTGENVNLIAT